MADDKFATETPAGKPAYPQWIKFSTGKKYANNEDICEEVLVKTPEDHKELLKNKGNAPSWDKK